MKKFLAVFALSTAALSLDASALAMNGTFAAAGLGATSYVGADLNSASQLNVAGTFVTTGLSATFLGNPNDLLGEMAVGDIGTIVNPILITGFVPVANFITWGSTTFPVNRFTFNLATLVRNPSASGAMDLYGTGTFSDSTAEYVGAPAAIRLTAQEIGGSTSYSFSWGSPPFDNPVPVPGVLGLMGLGLLGMRLARRRSA
jgi:MYXO-CTERM domain-containing protein